jgi:hypothetical protein
MRAGKDQPLFGAFVEPAGIYVVEYRRERDGISLMRHRADTNRVIGFADAGERLAAVIKAMGPPPMRLSAVMRGFGSTYQIMMLPPAEPAVLGAVVRRELARLNPEMDAPRIDYVLGGQIDRRRRERPEGGMPQREVLVGAAPEIALSAFGEELSLAGIELEHLTLLPQVMQRLYERADASPAPTACFVDLPGGPVIAFFHESQLRLVVEPPVRRDEDLATRIQVLSEHVDRGNLFLRQQFRGAELSRLLIAVKQEEGSDFLDALRASLHLPVENFPGPVTEPSALVCLGAVLDAEAEKGLNLSPFAESPAEKSERARRRAVGIAGAGLSALAVVWAIFSVMTTLSLSGKVDANRKLAAERVTTLAPLRVVAAERQKNAQSQAYLQSLRAGEGQIQEFVRGLVRATPPGVQLTSVSLGKNGAEWNVALAGNGYGETGADVLLGIDRLYHAIPREMTVHDLLVTELTDLPSDQFGAGMKFTMTYVLSPAARAAP